MGKVKGLQLDKLKTAASQLCGCDIIMKDTKRTRAWKKKVDAIGSGRNDCRA